MKITENEVTNLARFAKDGKIIIEVREGEAQKILDPIEPIQPQSINIKGRVGTIAEFLSKRAHQFKSDACNIIVDMNENIMTFTGNERYEDNKEDTLVSSKIIETKHYKKLDINNDREFAPLELATYLRKRKNMFMNPEQFNNIFTALSSFKAVIDKEVETVDKKDGNAVNSVRQKVIHNIPKIFELNVPVFEGEDPMKIEIEIDVNPNDLRCSLMSFDLEHKYDEFKQSLFEFELDQEISEKKKLRDFCVVYHG